MTNITPNSMTKFLDTKLPNQEDVEQFLDDLEEEIFGISNRDFYLRYKGDIKEILQQEETEVFDTSYEIELLTALSLYCKSRQ